MIRDLTLYRETLESYHPSLYRFTPEDTYKEAFDSIFSAISSQTTDLEFFRGLGLISTLIREGHSRVLPSKQLMIKAEKSKIFPLKVTAFSDRLVVMEAQSGIRAGSEIHYINGVSIEKIIDDLSTKAGLVSGNNNSYLLSRLSYDNGFGLAYFYCLDDASEFTLEGVYRGDPFDLELAGQYPGKETDFPRWASEPEPPVKYTTDQAKSTAHLQITTFADWAVEYKKRNYFKDFRQFFGMLEEQQIEHLIIDLRNNYGGDEMIGAELLSYFVDHPFSVSKSIQQATLDFAKINRLAENKLYYREKDYIETDSGYFQKKSERMGTIEPKEKNHFDGQVYLMANRSSFSATNMLLALIKTHKAATIVGQESAGVFEDVDGYARINFNLPNSDTRVTFPAWRVKINSSGGDPLRGVIPDYEINYGADDLVSGKDLELELIYSLIKGN